MLVGFFSFHGECLEFFSQQVEISLQAQERTAVLVISNRWAYIASGEVHVRAPESIRCQSRCLIVEVLTRYESYGS